MPEFNTELIEEVERLKGKRIVRKDVEIATATGFSQSVVSNYLSGRVKASKPFIAAFESTYHVKLFEKKLSNSEKPFPLDDYKIEKNIKIKRVYVETFTSLH